MTRQAGRRDTLKLLTAAALTGAIPRLGRAQATQDLYDLPRAGNLRVLHQTDTHAQLLPVLFREPGVNIGLGEAAGRPPHLVGEAFLRHYGVPAGSARAHAFTCLDFEEAAHRYGALGGFAQLKTLIDRLRAQAGPGNTLLLDGGDMWQGSWTAHASQGAALVQLANRLGVDAMTAHFEFTYGEAAVRRNLAAFRGQFIAQNVFLTDEAAFNGAESFDAASGRVFRPYVMEERGGRRIAVIGQCFPYQPIAHPRRFVENWTFGIREAELQAVVDQVRQQERADAVLLLSHNGMDVDLKLAGRVRGIDVILGGHTHDATPVPSVVENAGGRTLVTNAGSNGKFLGVLDLDVGSGRVNGLRYTLLPVFSNLLPADAETTAEIAALRRPDEAMLSERLAEAGELLYRRGNFSGTMDQVICDALREELDAQIALSPGFRWGPSLLPGDTITMEHVLAQTAITYPDVYVQEMTGAQVRTILEDVCDNLFNPDPYVQQGGDMVRVGGLGYACDPAQPIGRRISDLRLEDGTLLEAEKTYRVAGWASVNLPQEGRPVWEVVAAHLRRRKVVRPGRQGEVRLIGLAGNPGLLGPS
ncbi:thiosulfohydrolase SoxB [Roseicella aquatilis]|uniref:Thiosulfohydrolase SoxB n=1 Tax=Roseicella aquatilis TaxID=2527868 RepID=A0A4R4D4Y8_9PROT|nr:thiosulfohydrolase SoxB [Roseicella aquatilis]TCZ52762.1 thiosulfohydrolase SoxB [Roseicella aquatilis]